MVTTSLPSSEKSILIGLDHEGVTRRDVEDSLDELRQFAATAEGMDTFFQELELRLSTWRLGIRFRIPNGESALLAEIHRVGHVLSVTYEGDTAILTAHIPPELKTRLSPCEESAAPAA
jgi:50S ribosomal subunit-associated GTPase HflX